MPFPSPIETSNAAEVKASSVFWREVKFQLASSFALDLRKDYFSLFFSFHFSIGIEPHLTLYVLLIQTDRQLMYAMREIASAPAGLNDPELHAPLFLNVSIFKR